MILNRSFYGKFRGNPLIIGTTNKNEYFPVYSTNFYHQQMLDHYGYDYNDEPICENIIDNIYLYKKPVDSAKNHNAGITKYADLLHCLYTSTSADTFSFTVNDVVYFLTCSRGYIADENGNILLLLATKSQDIFVYDEELHTNNLKLFVSNRFVKEPQYKNVFKKIDTEYINFCYQNDIDVMFTTSEKITSSVYKNDFEVPFNSLTELHEHLNGDVMENYFYEPPVTEEEEVADLPF